MVVGIASEGHASSAPSSTTVLRIAGRRTDEAGPRGDGAAASSPGRAGQDDSASPATCARAADRGALVDAEAAARSRIAAGAACELGVVMTRAEASERELIAGARTTWLAAALVSMEAGARGAIEGRMEHEAAALAVEACVSGPLAACDGRDAAERLCGLCDRVFGRPQSPRLDALRSAASAWWTRWRCWFEERALRATDATAEVTSIETFDPHRPLDPAIVHYTAALTACCIALRTNAAASPSKRAASTASVLRTHRTAVTAITEITDGTKDALQRTDAPLARALRFGPRNLKTGHGYCATCVPATSPWQVHSEGHATIAVTSKAAGKAAARKAQGETRVREYDLPYVILTHHAATSADGRRAAKKVLFGAFHFPGGSWVRITCLLQLALDTLRTVRDVCSAQGVDGFVISLDGNFHNKFSTFVKTLEDKYLPRLSDEAAAGTPSDFKVHSFKNEGENALGALSWKLGTEVCRDLHKGALGDDVSDHTAVTSVTFRVPSVCLAGAVRDGSACRPH
jgi:hypothetical protein